MRSNCLALLPLTVLLMTVGCHNKRVPIAPLPPPPPPAPVPVPPATVLAPPPAAAPVPPPVVPNISPIDQARRAFSSGNYDEAARLYDSYLKATPPGTGQRDEALFRLGLIYALRPGPAADWQRAVVNFKQLGDEFPASPLKAEANLLLSLRTDLDQAQMDLKQRDQRIKQLTTELERLKKIDADRRKRP